MDLLAALGTLLALPALAGLNAYATVLTVGLLLRHGLLTHPVFQEPAFQVLASDPVLVGAGILYLVEFLADKVPGLDHAWDLVHTLIRPAVGAALGLAAMGAIDPQAGGPLLALAALLVGGAAAAAHLTKATTRVVATNLSLGSANWLLSLLEDLTAIGGAWLALVLPAVAGAAVLVFLALFLLLFPRIVRVLIALARKTGAAVRALLGGPQPDARVEPLREALPADVEATLRAAGAEGAIEVSVPVLLGRLGGRGGAWLVATPSHLARLERRWRRVRGPVVPIGTVATPVVRRGFLSDGLVLATPTGVWRLALLREPGRRAEAVAARIGALAATARAAGDRAAPAGASGPIVARG